MTVSSSDELLENETLNETSSVVDRENGDGVKVVNLKKEEKISDGIYDYINIDSHRLVYTLNYPIRMVSNQQQTPLPYVNTDHYSSSPSSPLINGNLQNRSRSSSTHSNNSTTHSNYQNNILLHNSSPRNASPSQNHSSPPHQRLSQHFQQQSAPIFVGQLPLPPGCNLFRIRSSLNNVSSENSRSEGELEILENVKKVNESYEKKIPVRIGFTKKEIVQKEEFTSAPIRPYNSNRLLENSLGYVYEDHWRVEESRPLLQETLISPSFHFMSQQPRSTATTTSTQPTTTVSSELSNNEISTSIDESTPIESETPPTLEEDKIISSSNNSLQQETQPPIISPITPSETLEDCKSKWKSKLLEKYPLIQELQERIYPLWRTTSFGEVFNAGQKEVRENLTEDIVLNIIMQHLRFEGLKQTRATLEEETQRKYLDIDVQQSLFHALAKEAIKKNERLMDLVIFDKFHSWNSVQKNKNVIMKSLEERLNDLGINEFGTTVNQSKEKESMNLWKEIVGGQNEIVHIDPVSKYEQFQAGTLNRIIERLLQSNTKAFGDVFLYTYMSLISPEILLNKLIQRFKIVPKKLSQEAKNNIQSEVIRFLLYWMENHYQHFTQNMVVRVENFLNESQSNTSPKFIKLKKDTLQLITQHKESSEKKKCSNDYLNLNINYPEPKIPLNKIFYSSLTLEDIDEEEVARQLCLYEWEIVDAIRLDELMSFGWKRSKLKHRSPNINNVLKHSSNMSKWVSAIICKGKMNTDRRNSYRRFVTICEHLKKFNNFNTLKSILTGLETGNDTKTLKAARSELPPKVRDSEKNLNQFMSSDSNYKEYREALRDAKNQVIPYLSIHLHDLYLIEENQNDYVMGSNNIELINWLKRESMFDLVKEFKYYKSLQRYNFIEVYQIQELIRNMSELSTNNSQQ